MLNASMSMAASCTASGAGDDPGVLVGRGCRESGGIEPGVRVPCTMNKGGSCAPPAGDRVRRSSGKAGEGGGSAWPCSKLPRSVLPRLSCAPAETGRAVCGASDGMQAVCMGKALPCPLLRELEAGRAVGGALRMLGAAGGGPFGCRATKFTAPFRSNGKGGVPGGGPIGAPRVLLRIPACLLCPACLPCIAAFRSQWVKRPWRAARGWRQLGTMRQQK